MRYSSVAPLKKRGRAASSIMIKSSSSSVTPTSRYSFTKLYLACSRAHLLPTFLRKRDTQDHFQLLHSFENKSVKSESINLSNAKEHLVKNKSNRLLMLPTSTQSNGHRRRGSVTKASQERNQNLLKTCTHQRSEIQSHI